ncbi:MAG: co-chaperone GroES [Candidatus Thiodiazotropha sp.]
MRPLHDRVLIRRMEKEQTSSGGIVIPDTATEKPTQGEVIAVGKGRLLNSGEIRPLDVKVGDRVLFAEYSGTEVKVLGEDVVVVREDEIMGVLE